MSGDPGKGAGVRTRLAMLARLAEPITWDIVVIGGGATGLGCAVDAAARGYSVLLVEARDFAKGTSSRATKLVHGGVRYLAQAQLPLVREALAERARLLDNAPHLVHPLRFVVPAYRFRDKPMLAAGLGLYDLLAGRRGIARSQVLDAARTVAALPTVQPRGLRGGIAYWDAQFDDARLALALARTVADLGGVALNYCPVTGLILEGGRVAGVEITDAETGARFKVSGRAVVNATGVWADDVRRMARADAPRMLKPSQGVHLVVDAGFLPGKDALLIPQTDDGRVLFMIPWQGKCLLGTTDTPRSDRPLEPEPLPGEIDFILETARRYLVRAPSSADVRSIFAGMRPLIGAGDASLTRQLSREHLVDVSAEGLISVLGGKWTTYRLMAEDAIDVAQSLARLPKRYSGTADLRLHGALAGSMDPYGSDREALDRIQGADVRLMQDASLTEAEVRYAVRAEQARTVEDVLARRHRALFQDARVAQALAPAVADLMADELARDGDWVATQVAEFSALADHYLPPS